MGDAQDFSGKTSITLSGDFSVETLTGVTLSWKTKLCHIQVHSSGNNVLMVKPPPNHTS